MSPLLTALRARGWVIEERADASALLPDHVGARYPRLPSEVAAFLGALAVCHNAAEDVWLLTPDEFRTTDDAGFRWNEYELMALDAADDAEAQSRIRAFWDAHVPIAMAVHSDYDYLAVRVAEPKVGSIVHGFGPEWDSPSIVADSFAGFVSRFAEQAASRDPAYPYSVFL